MAGKKKEFMGKKKTKEITIKVPDKVTGKIDVIEAIKLRLQGLTYQQIADHYGVAKSSAHECLKRYLPEHLDIETYRANEDDMLLLKQLIIYENLTLKNIKKMSPRDRFLSFGILQDKRRDLSGASGAQINQVVVNILNKSLERPQRRTAKEKAIDAEFETTNEDRDV